MNDKLFRMVPLIIAIVTAFFTGMCFMIDGMIATIFAILFAFETLIFVAATIYSYERYIDCSTSNNINNNNNNMEDFE